MIENIMEVEKRFGITLETRDMDRTACVGDLVQRIGDKTRTIGKR
jgi:acyl carrier protein